MRRYLLFLTALFFSFAANAQPLQTLYYSNGQKALEGNWTYTGAPVFEDFVFQSQVNRDTNAHWSVDDVFFHANHPFYGNSKSMSAAFRFEGTITAYYPEGPKRATANFKEGVQNGLYRFYYPDGKTAAQGTFINGMPAGNWEAYHPSGKRYYTGTYRPLSQEEAHAEWQAFFISGEETYTSDGTVNVYEEDSLREDTTYVGMATYRVRSLFAVHLKVLYVSSMRVGTFTFYNREGGRVAEVTYNRGKRDSLWQLWDDNGKPTHGLLYKANKVIAAADSGEVPLPINAYAQRAHDRAVAASNAQRTQAIKEAKAQEEARRQADAAPNRPPEFPGNINAYLSNNLNYPVAARDSNIQGKVVVQFWVETDGRISDLKVIKSAGEDLDKEALRVARGMPRWKPARKEGKPARAMQFFPVVFTLQ